MQLKYNYHTHTYRCGHAKGKDEEYVTNAISNGFKVLGFSDHVMIKWHRQPGTRGNYLQLGSYIKSINKLKKKYEKQIEIHLGLECEYMPQLVKYYKWLLKKKKIEYLILGQHCYLDKHGKFTWYLGYDNRDKRIELYVHDLIEGMKTGLFKYVCHPDFFVRLFKEYDPLIEKCARKICKAALKYDIPLELNTSGVSEYHLRENNLHFPSPYFWNIVGETGVKVVIGVDAHTPQEFKIANYKYVYDMIKRFQLNFIEDFRIDD